MCNTINNKNHHHLNYRQLHHCRRHCGIEQVLHHNHILHFIHAIIIRGFRDHCIHCHPNKHNYIDLSTSYLHYETNQAVNRREIAHPETLCSVRAGVEYNVLCELYKHTYSCHWFSLIDTWYMIRAGPSIVCFESYSVWHKTLHCNWLQRTLIYLHTHSPIFALV